MNERSLADPISTPQTLDAAPALPPIGLDVRELRGLEPLAKLSPQRLAELAGFCFREVVDAGLDPFRLRSTERQSVYLLAGELRVWYLDGQTDTLRAGEARSLYPLGRSPAIQKALAVTPVALVRIDDDLLDMLLTWDMLNPTHSSTQEQSPHPNSASTQVGNSVERHLQSGIFNLAQLHDSGIFANLPPAHIDSLLQKFEVVDYRKGLAVVRQGDVGDYYYVIQSGRVEVSRSIGNTTVHLAELGPGAAFGEEALVSGARRNATVAMLTDGVLHRLSKHDFNELLKAPLLNEVNYQAAQQLVNDGALWLDVRFPSEYQFDRLPDAKNIPLGELRNVFHALDPQQIYIVYCQSGRRSAAAAFLLKQRGFKAYVLQGGLWNIRTI